MKIRNNVHVATGWGFLGTLQNMKTPTRLLRSAIVLTAAAGLFVAATRGADQPGFSRKVVQDQDVSVAGHHAVVAVIDFGVGAVAARHTHPGEEFGYVIEGTFELTIDGKAPQVLKSGDSFFIPAGAI